MKLYKGDQQGGGMLPAVLFVAGARRQVEEVVSRKGSYRGDGQWLQMYGRAGRWVGSSVCGGRKIGGGIEVGENGGRVCLPGGVVGDGGGARAKPKPVHGVW